MQESDKQLILAIQSGDVSAFERLVRRHEQKLIRFALRYTKDAYLAEEVVQDAFVSVYKHIGIIDPKKSFLSFMFAIVHNQAISALRKVKKHISLEEIPEMQHDAAFIEKMIKKEQKAIVRKTLGNLPEKYAKILRLRYFDDISYEKISKILEIPLNTVRTHLRRAKNLVKEDLQL